MEVHLLIEKHPLLTEDEDNISQETYLLASLDKEKIVTEIRKMDSPRREYERVMTFLREKGPSLPTEDFEKELPRPIKHPPKPMVERKNFTDEAEYLKESRAAHAWNAENATKHRVAIREWETLIHEKRLAARQAFAMANRQELGVFFQQYYNKGDIGYSGYHSDYKIVSLILV